MTPTLPPFRLLVFFNKPEAEPTNVTIEPIEPEADPETETEAEADPETEAETETETETEEMNPTPNSDINPTGLN